MIQQTDKKAKYYGDAIDTVVFHDALSNESRTNARQKPAIYGVKPIKKNLKNNVVVTLRTLTASLNKRLCLKMKMS